MSARRDLVSAAIERLDAAGADSAEAALILGSGLSYLADEMEDAVTVPYRDIPGFPTSSVEGHAGNFVVGWLQGVRVAMAQGRFHLYEGHGEKDVALPLRVLAELGPAYALVTNAAGSLDPRNPPGTLLAIVDHLNLQFANPLIGRPPRVIENPFPDMSNAYDRERTRRLMDVAVEHGIELRSGVYAAVLGPSYETAAEIIMLRRMGADAVGMSTVPETIVAAEIGLPIVGVSLLTNYATGLSTEPLEHHHVTEVADEARPVLGRLVRLFIAGEAKVA